MSTIRYRKFASILFVTSLLTVAGWSQAKPPSGGTGGGGGGTTGGGTTSTTTTSVPPSRPPTSIPNPSQDFNRPIFLTGKVILDHGVAISQPIPVERVCNGTVRREGYTDSRGNFSIMLGDNTAFQDASESGGFGTRPNQGINPRTLWNCEIRAVLPGYTSSSILLAGRDFNGNPDIGTLVLAKAGGVEGDSISVVSLKAPDKARKEFEKGREDFTNKKYENAEKHLAKAVELYPQYALAWELRGQEQEKQKQLEEADKSFESAISADPKFVPPYIRLALLQSSKSNWADVVRLTQRALELDPVNYPDAYFLNGAAHYNLKQLPEAEKSAMKAVELDKEHRFARSELLLGSILQIKGQNAAAAEHFRAYLKLEPNSTEAPRLLTYIAQVDQQSASAHPAPAPQKQ
jgi:tetratricopeptide (TPR) repeat protein